MCLKAEDIYRVPVLSQITIHVVTYRSRAISRTETPDAGSTESASGAIPVAARIPAGMDGWMDRRLDDGWMEGWKDRWIEGWMDGLNYGRMEGWVDKR